MVHCNINTPGATRLSLALQGGGAHGAFTWGVLDRLLEVPGLSIEAISATSSGAMNACALAQGWARHGPTGARAALKNFWYQLAACNTPPGWWATTARTFYQASAWSRPPEPLSDFNPLRPLVQEFFDIPVLQNGPVGLYLAATRVRDGQLVLFDRERLSHDALLASACLPLLFGAVKVDGEDYWDGGFAGNPVLEPLLRPSLQGDLLVVLLQPAERGPMPILGRDIAERAAQFTFNAAFAREIRGLSHVRRRLHGRFWLSSEEKRLKSLRLHLIAPPGELARRSGNSALDARLTNLRSLFNAGRAAAENWILRHGAALGQRSTYAARTHDEPVI